jgi:CDP-archaeol synthase
MTTGLVFSVAAMLGDSLTSFIKRRVGGSRDAMLPVWIGSSKACFLS